MAKKRYLNSVAALIERAQKPIGDFLDGASAATFDDWTLVDLSLCKGPALKMKFEGRMVLYNKVEHIIYIEDFTSCVVNDICGIINEIRWNT